MQSSVNSVLELQLIQQVQITENSTILTFLIPTTGATIVITNAVFPEGIHTSVQHIAPYIAPNTTADQRLSTLPILQVQPVTPTIRQRQRQRQQTRTYS